MSRNDMSLDFDKAITDVDEQVKKGNFRKVIRGNATVTWAYGAGDREESKDCKEM